MDGFPKFQRYVCTGDSVETVVDGITYTAHIEYDQDSESPDKRDEGFWPSLDPKSAGFIGKKSKAMLQRHMDRAKGVLAAWRADQWFYCGVVVSASIVDDDGNTVLLDDHCASLWGIECNYPTFRKRDVPNAYLQQCANDLLIEAIDMATAAKQRIHAATA